MEAHARSPRDLFEGKPHYEIPLFQRPYVWNEEDQWAPLWEDVIRVAEVTSCQGRRDGPWFRIISLVRSCTSQCRQWLAT